MSCELGGIIDGIWAPKEQSSYVYIQGRLSQSFFFEAHFDKTGKTGMAQQYACTHQKVLEDLKFLAKSSLRSRSCRSLISSNLLMAPACISNHWTNLHSTTTSHTYFQSKAVTLSEGRKGLDCWLRSYHFNYGLISRRQASFALESSSLRSWSELINVKYWRFRSRLKKNS